MSLALRGVINSEQRLMEVVGQLRGADWVALDTEADSLHAYPEKLCLIQVSYADREELIDPLASLNLAPLLEELRRHELLMHGADYDLRLFYRTFRFVPDRVFDTMWAARLLGIAEFGLTHLVSRFLGVTLEKGPQKMNWARRPLTERMEKYARNDTHYLKPLSDVLRAQLVEKGRAGWHEEICARMIFECTQARVVEPDQVWRVKGSDRLSRGALAILRELWQWREQEALQANKPPFFVLSHEDLVKLALELSNSGPEPAVPAQVRGSRRTRLQEAMARALKITAAEYPVPRRIVPRRLTRSEQERFDRLRRRRDQVAGELGLEPTLVATRTNLVQLARSDAAARQELMNWQRELLLEQPALPRY